MRKVLFTTPLPVPYQVELFDALAASGEVDMKVLYEFREHSSRSWVLPKLSHEYKVLREIGLAGAQNFLSGSDLIVFSGYYTRQLRQLIAARHASREPWVFWGERPGYFLPQWLSQYYRAIILPQLRSVNVPVWGMGSWAVEAYRRQLGNQRTICNVPYFSRLDRYFRIDRSRSAAPPRRILFSGSLIKRKGVDLLLKAFVAIASEFPELELHLIGNGPLREQLRTASAPVAERVRFHGFKQWAELPAIYDAADILCAPSRYDGWGLIIPEGLASGLLVVSTNRTGAALDLVGSDCGWIVQAGVLEPLIEALRAAASTSGSDRLARIEKGRSVAADQDVSAGVDRVLAAIDKSLELTTVREHSAFGSSGQFRPRQPQ